MITRADNIRPYEQYTNKLCKFYAKTPDGFNSVRRYFYL